MDLRKSDTSPDLFLQMSAISLIDENGNDIAHDVTDVVESD